LRKRTSGSGFKRVVGEVEEARADCEALIDLIRQYLKDDPHEVPREFLERVYGDLVADLEDGRSGPHAERRLRMQCSKMVRSLSGLPHRVETFLLPESLGGDQEARRLDAFRQLPFVINFETLSRCAPFATLEGLDAIAALLRKSTSKVVTRVRAKPRSSAPRLKHPSVSRRIGAKDLRFDPKRLREAKNKRRHKNADMVGFFGVKDESTVSKWLNSKMDMSCDSLKKYDDYIKILSPAEPE
jgi:hypothetical protein